jgi:hypothetical protein
MKAPECRMAKGEATAYHSIFLYLKCTAMRKTEAPVYLSSIISYVLAKRTQAFFPILPTAMAFVSYGFVLV